LTANNLLNKINALAQKAAECIGISFATVDIAGLSDGSIKIMEINAGVTAMKLLEQHPEKRDMVKGIYRTAIRSMMNPS
jgi:glutathione synthase/RimK-type ligase-like ATP-grasp enzyme